MMKSQDNLNQIRHWSNLHRMHYLTKDQFYDYLKDFTSPRSTLIPVPQKLKQIYLMKKIYNQLRLLQKTLIKHTEKNY